jgi:hypothetical protein
MFSPAPSDLLPTQRALLAEFERLHAQWRVASAAADEVECATCAQDCAIDMLLRQRLAADQVHQQAMRLLRSAPL